MDRKYANYIIERTVLLGRRSFFLVFSTSDAKRTERKKQSNSRKNDDNVSRRFFYSHNIHRERSNHRHHRLVSCAFSLISTTNRERSIDREKPSDVDDVEKMGKMETIFSLFSPLPLAFSHFHLHDRSSSAVSNPMTTMHRGKIISSSSSISELIEFHHLFFFTAHNNIRIDLCFY